MDWDRVPQNGQEWNSTAFHLFICYIIVYLFVTDNKQCLFGNHVYQTLPLFFPPPPPPCSPPLPTILITTTSHDDCTQQAQPHPHWFPPPTLHANAGQWHQSLHVTLTEWQPPPHQLQPPTHLFRLHLTPQHLTATLDAHHPFKYDPCPFVWPHLAPQCSTAMPECPHHQNSNQHPVDYDLTHSFGLTLYPNASTATPDANVQQPHQSTHVTRTATSPLSTMTPANLFMPHLTHQCYVLFIKCRQGHRVLLIINPVCFQ